LKNKTSHLVSDEQGGWFFVVFKAHREEYNILPRVRSGQNRHRIPAPT